MIKKTTKIILRIFLALAFVMTVLAGLFAWQMTTGSFPINQAIPYIEEAFEKAAEEGENISIGHLSLNWQGWQNPLGLSATDVMISTSRGPYLFAPEVDMNLSLRSIITGTLYFETLTIRNIALSITRTENGNINLTGRGVGQDAPTSQDAALLTPTDLVNDLAFIDRLKIENARVTYNDEAEDIATHFDPVTIIMNYQGNGKVQGTVSAPLNDLRRENAIITTMNYEINNDPGEMRLWGEIRDFAVDHFIQFVPNLPDTIDLNMVVDADIDVRFDNQWRPIQLNATVDGERGQIFFPFNADIDFMDVTDFNAVISQDTADDMIDVETLSMRMFDNTNLTISGSFKNMTDPAKLFGNAKIIFENLPQTMIAKYWPENYTDNGVYEWVVEKMDGGVFDAISIETVFDKGATTRDDGNPLPPQIISAKGEVAFTGLNIDYKSPLPPAMNTTGTGMLDQAAMTLNITESTIGGMVTRGAALFFDDLITKGSGLGTLTFPITANTQDVFDFISGDPINAFDKIDFSPRDTKGDVTATVRVEIPLLKETDLDDVKVMVEGQVENADIPNVTRGLDLSGGPFEVFATTEEIKVTGSGQLQGRPIKLDWHEYFSSQNAGDYLSKITANVVANDAIRRAFTNDFANYFRGDSRADLVYEKAANGRSSRINLDLDLTETAIIEPTFGLDKKFGENVTGTLQISLNDGNLTSIDNLVLRGRALSLRNGSMTFMTENQEPLITSASLQNLAFNENRISILMEGDRARLKTNITGAFLDSRPILSREKDEVKKDVEAGRAMSIGIDVLEMRTADTATLKNVNAFVGLTANGRADQFEMDAALGDGGQAGKLFIRYTPQVDDGLTLRIESDNAGEALRAFDLYPYIQGGELQVAGVPLDGGRFGDVRGRARINNFSVANAPVLLRLINALSFQSFMQAGQLSFTRLESDFEWQQGANGDIYKITNGTTSGASVAFTFDGIVDTNEDKMEIKGTAAPLSTINNFVGKIPLIGQILTGGDALLAATYTVSGDPQDPSVAVNPLSVLAPGIIRKMLFENTSSNDRP